MNAFWGYIRRHPWQRRIVTLLLAALVGMAAALLLYPTARWRLLRSHLASPDLAEHRQAVEAAVRLGRQDAGFVKNLNAALASPDDRLFEAAAEALVRLERFYDPGRDTRQIDRYWRISYQRSLADAIVAGSPTTGPSQPAGSGPASQPAVGDMLGCGWFGKSCRPAGTTRRRTCCWRRPFSTPQRPSVPRWRCWPPVTTIGRPSRRYWATPTSAVRAAVMEDVGLARRDAYAPLIAGRLQLATDPDELAAAALALTRLRGSAFAADLAVKLAAAPAGGLRDKLLWLAGMLYEATPGAASRPAIEPLRQAVLKAIQDDPSPMAILAAGRLRPAQAAAIIMPMLGEPETLSPAAWPEQLAAATHTAMWMDLGLAPPPLKWLLRQPYDPRLEPALMEAARMEVFDARAAEQLARGPVDLAPRLAALRPLVEQTASPLAAAAGAVATWELDPAAGEPEVLDAAGSDTPYVGDWVAWRLARLDPAAARRIGRELLDVRYNTAAKAAGAMMLALASAGSAEHAEAVAAIRQRLGPAEAPLPRAGVLADSYRCALLILGQDEFRPRVERCCCRASSRTAGR